jgi:hypothetical protein
MNLAVPCHCGTSLHAGFLYFHNKLTACWLRMRRQNCGILSGTQLQVPHQL